jgi:hypothetical protein
MLAGFRSMLLLYSLPINPTSRCFHSRRIEP